MNERKLWQSLAVVVLVLVSPSVCVALDYVPYAGFSGYQEIRVDKEVYFVAFHGDDRTALEDVKSAWALRVAELCANDGMNYFIALKYSFEPVLKDERIGIRQGALWQGGYVKVGGGFIYIPMYLPGPNPNAFVSAPSWQKHVICFGDLVQATDQARAVDVKMAIQNGRERGWIK